MQYIRFGYLGKGLCGGRTSMILLPNGVLLWNNSPLMWNTQYLIWNG